MMGNCIRAGQLFEEGTFTADVVKVKKTDCLTAIVLEAGL